MTALYIGGAYQKKEAVARQIHGEKAFIYPDLHVRIRECLATGVDPMSLLPRLMGKIVICDEIGCGIVPLSKEEDAWRESVGRICCEIAARADLVVRVSMGIPQVIRGTFPCSES